MYSYMLKEFINRIPKRDLMIKDLLHFHYITERSVEFIIKLKVDRISSPLFIFINWFVTTARR